MKNILLLAALFAAIQTKSFSQPVIKKQKTIGGFSRDNFQSMCLTKDGGLIVGGTSESNASGDKTEGNRGAVDYWIVKLNKQRKIEWDKTIGGDQTDALYSLQQTSDGGYIVGGSSESGISGEKSENSKGSFDYWILKLDSTGNIEWDKTIGGNDVDGLSCMQQTCDGGYILGGESFSNKSGDKTGNSRGTADYWIVKLDKHGEIQWDKTFGGSDYDVLYSLQQTRDTGYILGGYSISNISGEKTENSRGDYDYWIIRLNKHGQIQWDKTIGGNDRDLLLVLQQTSDDGYILGGRSSSNISGEKTENNRGIFSEDYWMVKLNKKGQIQWDKTIGGIENDILNSLQQTIDGGYILGGYSDSDISGEKTENSRGDFDYWVVKLNGRGKMQWDKTIGGNRHDALYQIREIEKNKYVCGGSSSSDISGDKTENPKGGSFDTDYWIVSLQYEVPKNITMSAIGSQQYLLSKDDKNFTIYPNPARDVLHIQINGKATVSLINQLGNLVLTKTITSKGDINISALPAGVYFLKNNVTGMMRKVVVQK